MEQRTVSLACGGRKAGLLAALAVLLPCAASPQTANTTMAVSATVLKVCLVAATPLAFGNYTASSGTPTDATATVSVTCTNGAAYEVALDAGLGSGATTTTRRMTFLTNTLNYQMFRDAGRSQNWGSTAGADTVSGTGSGSLINHTVYGRIAISQYNTQGAYVDTVTVTVTY